MLRLFSLPDRESPGNRCQMTARSARTFRAKAEIVFLRQEMGRIRKIKRKASHTANGKVAPNCILLRSLCHRDLRGDQVVRLIRKPILYYPLFLLPSSLFGKDLQNSRILMGRFPTLNEIEKDETLKMGQSWAISDEKWGWLEVDNLAESEMHKMRKKR